MSHSHDSHDSHDAHDDPKVIKKHLKIYWGIFAALMVGSALTVAVAYLEMPIYLAITVAVLIASTKASLVAGFFMHLIGEVKAIWWSLALTAIFFVLLMALPILTENDNMGEYAGTPPRTIAQIDEEHAKHAAEHGEESGEESHTEDAHEAEAESH